MHQSKLSFHYLPHDIHVSRLRSHLRKHVVPFSAILLETVSPPGVSSNPSKLKDILRQKKLRASLAGDANSENLLKGARWRLSAKMLHLKITYCTH